MGLGSPVYKPLRMRAVDVIRGVRDGEPLRPADLAEFIQNVSNGHVADYQVAAFLMAVYFRGLSPPLLTQLTHSMRDSGTVLDWSEAEKPLIVDKHSTGGVGDKVSLVLAPLAAACGVKVPMISGRGLGHTGGTLDKLESIPGFEVNLPIDKLQAQVSGPLGCAMVGQSERIAPVDKLLYAMRDVTATVESVPLITSSILAKKTAAGLSGLVLDLKIGNGAFMKTRSEAEKLAAAISETAELMGLRVSILFTNMDQPLGEWIGNYAELFEAYSVLQGTASPAMADTRELSIELAAEMVAMGLKLDVAQARALVVSKLESRQALAKFEALVRAQKGDLSQCKSIFDHIGPGKPVEARASGYVTRIDTMSLGTTCMKLGGGRAEITDPIDHNVSIQMLKKVGDSVTSGEPVARVYYETLPAGCDEERIIEEISSAFSIVETQPKRPHLILHRSPAPAL